MHLTGQAEAQALPHRAPPRRENAEKEFYLLKNRINLSSTEEDWFLADTGIFRN